MNASACILLFDQPITISLAKQVCRAGQPAELAAAYVLLASNDSSYMTGSTIQVTGGTPSI